MTIEINPEQWFSDNKEQIQATQLLFLEFAEGAAQGAFIAGYLEALGSGWKRALGTSLEDIGAETAFRAFWASLKQPLDAKGAVEGVLEVKRRFE